MVMQPKVKYDLFISAAAGGHVTTPGEGLFTGYNPGAVVNLVATPDAGYGFVNWTGDVGTIANVNAATTTITMNGDYSITANFESLYGPPVTIKFYPTYEQAGPACDGHVLRSASVVTWANIHDNAGTLAYDSNTAAVVEMRSSLTTNRWLRLIRAIFNFDTRLLPAGSLITAAKVALKLFDKGNTSTWNPSYAIVEGTLPNPTKLIPADYQTLLTIPLTNAFSYSTLVVDTYYNFIIDPAFFSIIKPASITKLGCRDITYDAPNNEPSWQAAKSITIDWYTRESSLSNRPYLEVIYQPPL